MKHTSGCLSDAEMATVREAAPGAVPEAMAKHLASCAGCQERLLFGGDRGPREARKRAVAPSPDRLVLLVLCLIGMLALFAWSLHLLVGGGGE